MPTTARQGSNCYKKYIYPKRGNSGVVLAFFQKEKCHWDTHRRLSFTLIGANFLLSSNHKTFCSTELQGRHKLVLSFSYFLGPKKVKAQKKEKAMTKILFKLLNGKKIGFNSMVNLKAGTNFYYFVDFHSVITDRPWSYIKLLGGFGK